MRLLLLATTGGALGAALRFLVNVGFARALGAGFPWATVFVNVFGSFAMGFVIETLALRYNNSPEMRTFLATGILGGFTTFSAFSLDFAQLMQRGDTGQAMAYALISVIVSIAALYAGLAFAKGVLT